MTRKETKRENARITIGDKAQALAAEIAGESTPVTAAHLEAAIHSLMVENARLKDEAGASKRSSDGTNKKHLQGEMDLLFSDVKTELDDRLNPILDAMNGMRQMLNIFGEEVAGEEVDEMIKENNKWLDRVIKPIAQSKEEGERRRKTDARNQDENEHLPDETNTATVHHANGSDQRNLPLEPDRAMDDGRGR